MTPRQLASQLRDLLPTCFGNRHCPEDLALAHPCCDESIDATPDVEVIEHMNTCPCCLERLLSDTELDYAISQSRNAIEFLQYLRFGDLYACEEDLDDFNCDDMLAVEVLIAAHIYYGCEDLILSNCDGGDATDLGERLSNQLVSLGATLRGAEVFIRNKLEKSGLYPDEPNS